MKNEYLIQKKIDNMSHIQSKIHEFMNSLIKYKKYFVNKIMLTITPKELALLLKNPEKIELIDVRSTGEYNEVHIPSARNIPLHLIPIKMNEIDSKKQVIFICHSGARSSQACRFSFNSNIQAYNLT